MSCIFSVVKKLKKIKNSESPFHSLRYIDRVASVTFKVVFIHLSTSSLGSIICFYAILMVNGREKKIDRAKLIHECRFQFNYLPAYGLQFGMLFQIFINCLLGNFVNLAVCLLQLNHFNLITFLI